MRTAFNRKWVRRCVIGFIFLIFTFVVFVGACLFNYQVGVRDFFGSGSLSGVVDSMTHSPSVIGRDKIASSPSDLNTSNQVRVFYKFNCPFCHAAQPVLEDVFDDYQVSNVVYINVNSVFGREEAHAVGVEKVPSIQIVTPERSSVIMPAEKVGNEYTVNRSLIESFFENMLGGA